MLPACTSLPWSTRPRRIAQACALTAAAAALTGCAQRPPAGPQAAVAPAEVRVSGELAFTALNEDGLPAPLARDAVAVVEVRQAAEAAALAAAPAAPAPLAVWRLPLAGRALPQPFELTLRAASASASGSGSGSGSGSVSRQAPAATASTAIPAAAAHIARGPSRELLMQARIEEAGRATWVAEPLAVRLPAGGGTLDAGRLLLQPQRVVVTALRCGREALVAELVGDALRLRGPLAFDAAPLALDLARAPAASGARWQAATDAGTWAWNKGTRWSVSLQGRALAECRPAAPALPAQQALQARGHEPAWQLELRASRLRLQLPERNRPLDAAAPPPRAVLGGWRWEARSAGEPLAVTVHERLCRDSMTGQPHPRAVSVQRGDRIFDGCGGTPAALLRGNWRVTQLDGQALPAEPRVVTLSFEAPTGPAGGAAGAGGDLGDLRAVRAGRADRAVHTADAAHAAHAMAAAGAAGTQGPAGATGRITGRAPCNDYSGRWSLGEALRFAQVAATRRACAPDVAARETAFFQILKAASSFDIRDDGRLHIRGQGRELTAVRD